MAFNDVADPVGQLTDPAERTETILGQPFSNPAGVLDWFSPSHIIDEFVKAVTGYDVFGEAAKAFAGDWEVVWQAAGTFRISETVSGILKDIGDAAMIGVVAASAGTAAIETGVGFVTGWGIAAYEAYKVAELTDQARKLIATASTLIGTVVGEVQALSAETGALSRHPLPGAGYKHPESRPA